MSTLTPELWDEIAHHLHASSDIRHGVILRDMERGLDAEQIASSQRITIDNATGYVTVVGALLRGELPTTPSSALKIARIWGPGDQVEAKLLRLR